MVAQGKQTSDGAGTPDRRSPAGRPSLRVRESRKYTMVNKSSERVLKWPTQIEKLKTVQEKDEGQHFVI